MVQQEAPVFPDSGSLWGCERGENSFPCGWLALVSSTVPEPESRTAPTPPDFCRFLDREQTSVEARRIPRLTRVDPGSGVTLDVSSAIFVTRRSNFQGTRSGRLAAPGNHENKPLYSLSLLLPSTVTTSSACGPSGACGGWRTTRGPTARHHSRPYWLPRSSSSAYPESRCLPPDSSE